MEGNIFLKYSMMTFQNWELSDLFHEDMREIVSWLGSSHPFQRVGRHDSGTLALGDCGWEGPSLQNGRNKHRPEAGMLHCRVTITHVWGMCYLELSSSSRLEKYTTWGQSFPEAVCFSRKSLELATPKENYILGRSIPSPPKGIYFWSTGKHSS